VVTGEVKFQVSMLPTKCGNKFEVLSLKCGMICKALCVTKL